MLTDGAHCLLLPLATNEVTWHECRDWEAELPGNLKWREIQGGSGWVRHRRESCLCVCDRVCQHETFSFRVFVESCHQPMSELYRLASNSQTINLRIDSGRLARFVSSWPGEINLFGLFFIFPFPLLFAVFVGLLRPLGEQGLCFWNCQFFRFSLQFVLSWRDYILAFWWVFLFGLILFAHWHWMHWN